MRQCPIQVDFNRSVAKSEQIIGVWAPIQFPKLLPVHPGAVSSSLRFFRSSLYTNLRSVLIYHEGDEACLEHCVDEHNVYITIEWVWLVRSALSVIKHNLTASLTPQESVVGRTRFSISLRKCLGCNLHIWSRLNLSSEAIRMDQEHYAHVRTQIQLTGATSDNPIMNHGEAVPLIIPTVAAVVVAIGSACCCVVAKCFLHQAFPCIQPRAVNRRHVLL